jgi:hypothetical protein
MKVKPPPRLTPSLKEEFYEALKLDPKKLKDVHIRALIKRVAFLDDNERFKFRDVLVRENLTKEEEERARVSFAPQWFYLYFPPKDQVEEHYKVNFTNGRS